MPILKITAAARGLTRGATPKTADQKESHSEPGGENAADDGQGGDGEALRDKISWSLLGRLWGRMRQQLTLYVGVCVAGLVVASLEMIPPRLVGQVVDDLTTKSARFESVLWAAGLWGLVVLVLQMFHAAQIGLANRAGERVLAVLRRDVFAHLQKLPISFFDRTHIGKIISRASSDIDAMRNVVVWGANNIVANGAMMLLATSMLIQIDLQLFLAVVWILPVMLVVSFLYANRVGRAWQSVLQHSARVSAAQTENISGVRVVTAFNRQLVNLSKYRDINTINSKNNIQASQLSGFFQASLQIIRFGGQGLILLYGGYRVAMGSLRAGDLVSASLYWECLMNPTISYGIFFNDLMIAMASAARVFTLLDLEAAPRGEEIALSGDLAGDVRFEKVTFAYRKGHPVLHEVDLCVPAGATVALVGATGSGKSTIISLLSRFYQPQAGRILVGGYDLRQLPKQLLREKVALVSQNNYLFSGTVLDNLRYGRPDASLAQIIAAAQTLGCHERILKLKDGYDTEVGERGANLSLGERQLLCFTRALVADPALLLLDEATSAMDPATEQRIQQAMGRLIEGRTTFIVAHRLTTVVKADLILVMAHGRIVEQGTHSELLALGGRYAQLVHHYHQDSTRLIS